MLQRLEGKRCKRRGATPVWLAVVLLCGCLGWLVTSLRASAGDAGFTTVDPARVDFELPAGEAGLPSEWTDIVALQLARLGELSVLDESLAPDVTAALEQLPFVREVGSTNVVWPDGLSVDIRLREPVACINLGDDFLPVSTDGVILPGYRSGPPDFGRGLLPVIGPLDASFRNLRPGDVLSERRHLDALSVAISMREHLSPGDLNALGPVVIDAAEAEHASVREPGTRLWLESCRKILFGRPPSHGAPGELPESEKWEHVMDAVMLLYPDAQSVEDGAPTDWDLLDVRWDVATLRPRVGYR